jgi:hypothetical protein
MLPVRTAIIAAKRRDVYCPRVFQATASSAPCVLVKPWRFRRLLCCQRDTTVPGIDSGSAALRLSSQESALAPVSQASVIWNAILKRPRKFPMQDARQETTKPDRVARSMGRQAAHVFMSVGGGTIALTVMGT